MAVVAYVHVHLRGHHASTGSGSSRTRPSCRACRCVIVPFIAILEFLSTFILRPITLTLRLTMNMVAGHMLLVLCFLATQLLLRHRARSRRATRSASSASAPSPSASPSRCSRSSWPRLQAYVFTILTAIYIQLALADEH